MKTNNIDEESDIVAKAASVLRENFIEASRNGTVLYAKNDAIWRQEANGEPILIKQLYGRIPELAKKLSSEKTYKIGLTHYYL